VVGGWRRGGTVGGGSCGSWGGSVGGAGARPQWLGKLSKSLYVRYGPAYADLPEAFLDLDLLLDQYGDDALWTEITRWATEPRRLHRSYTVDYLADLIHTPAPAPALDRRTA
jgi:hypothetical protein